MLALPGFSELGKTTALMVMRKLGSLLNGAIDAEGRRVRAEQIRVCTLDQAVDLSMKLALLTQCGLIHPAVAEAIILRAFADLDVSIPRRAVHAQLTVRRDSVQFDVLSRSLALLTSTEGPTVSATTMTVENFGPELGQASAHS